MFLLMSLIGTLAFAGPTTETKDTKEAPAKKVSLQPEFKPYDVSPTSKGALPTIQPKAGMKVTTGCTSDPGLNYAAGEPGYDTCMSQLQMKASEYGNKGAKDKKDGAGATVNFKIGE